jgi:hypothetical protein
LVKNEVDPYSRPQIHFVKHREMKKCHVFKVLIHIDVVEDLYFYHYPRNERIADGKVPWREFSWQYGVPDGEAQDDDLSPLHSACRPDSQLRRDPGDDDDSEPKRSRPTGFMVKMSSWMESRGRSKHRASEREMGRGWYHGESSAGRHRALLNSSPPPSHSNAPREEKKALWWLWQAKEKASTNTTPEGKDRF